MSRDFRLRHTPFDVLTYEIVEEQAAALGRMGRALEAALAELREFDATHPSTGASVSAQHARRVKRDLPPTRVPTRPRALR